MDQKSQRTSSLSPADLPMKRKRGRPRKDENLVLGKKIPVTPGSDSMRKNKESAGTSDDVNHDMVGQVVTGVIEGSFDAGYLLNVKVGDTNTQMRGVVFLPGLFTPITAANDVAPHAKMHTRKEIPIPVLNPQTQVHNSVPLSGQSGRRPNEHKIHAPKLSDQLISSGIQTAMPNPLENQSASVLVPPAANLPKNDASLSLGENEAPRQTLEPGLETQSASIMSQPDHDKVVERDELLQECEASTVIKGHDLDAEAAKESKAEPASDSVVVDAVPGIEIFTKEPQVQNQAASLTLNPNESKNPNLELNQTPVFAEPKPMETVMEDQASPKEDIAQASLLELHLLNRTPASDPADTTELGSHSTLQTSQLAMMNTVMEDQASPKENIAQASLLELHLLNGTPVSDPTDTTELGSHSTPQTSQLAMMDTVMEDQASPKEDIAQASLLELHLLNGTPARDPADTTELGSHSTLKTSQLAMMNTVMEDQASPNEDIAQASLLELHLLNGTPARDPADTTELGSHSTPQTSQLAMMDTMMEDLDFPKEDIAQASLLELHLLHGTPTSDPADTTELGSHSTPETSQLAIKSDGEVIPSETKLVSEMIEPQISVSGATSDMEYNVKDAIPYSTQS
jgi:hypothetical protein